MILYFEDTFGQRREIGRPQSTKELSQMMNQFLEEHRYKSYYTRSWKNDKDEIYYDVGSWSEFFVLIKE